MHRILLVEDEKIMAKNIAFFLEKEGFHISIAYDGMQGWSMFQEQSFHLVLLDWTLPGMDGLSLCRSIRKQSEVPIMMITAKEEIMDKVVGLEVGADDYLTKPFHQRELLARIHALLRRQRTEQGSIASQELLVYQGMELDNAKLQLRFEGNHAMLTVIEFKLLDVLIRHPEHIYTRDYLLEHVWGSDASYHDRTVDVSISRLRRKLAELTDRKYIEAVRGMGYRLGGGQ